MPPPATKKRKTADTGAIATDADASLGNSGGEQKASTVTLASLAEIDHDLLRQILGWAQPPEHYLRFEWSGSVGRTCRKFHELSREDSDYNRGVAIDTEEFKEYVPIFPATTRPRDLRLALLQRLIEGESMRARVDKFHFNFTGEMSYRRHGWEFDDSPVNEETEHK